MHGRLEEVICDKISPKSLKSAEPFGDETIFKNARGAKWLGRTLRGTFFDNSKFSKSWFLLWSYILQAMHAHINVSKHNFNYSWSLTGEIYSEIQRIGSFYWIHLSLLTNLAVLFSNLHLWGLFSNVNVPLYCQKYKFIYTSKNTLL